MTSYARGSNPSAEQRARDDRQMSIPTTGPGPQRIPQMPRPSMPVEPMGPMGPIGGPRGPIMDERPPSGYPDERQPPRPRMPDDGGNRSDMMRRIMEMFRSRENAEQRPQRRGPSRQDRRQNDLIYDMPKMRPRMPMYQPYKEEEMPSRVYRMMQRQPRPPMMMSDGGSAWRGSLPQGYEADEELRAQALADINAGADINGDNLISDEELYNWRPSDARYGTNPNNRVNRDQAYSQAALDTLRRKGAEMGDDGVFSEDEFWKFDAARQQNEGQNYGGATLEGEFNYQDPSTWNAPQPPMPERMPMPPSQTTYVPEPARNPYVFGGYGSPPPQYAGMDDPRMTNIVGMAPPSYYGGAEE